MYIQPFPGESFDQPADSSGDQFDTLLRNLIMAMTDETLTLFTSTIVQLLTVNNSNPVKYGHAEGP